MRLRIRGIRTQKKSFVSLAILFCLPKALGARPGTLHKENLWLLFEKTIGHFLDFHIVEIRVDAAAFDLSRSVCN